MSLRSNDARPLHTQIAEEIRQRIADGTYAVGGRLPSLRALSQEYGVAEPTVHAAIRALQQADLVTSTSGRGTFVNKPVEAAAPSVEAQMSELRERVDSLARRLDRLDPPGDSHEENDQAADQ